MRVLVIPDFHAPFEHIDAIDFLQALKEKYRPKVIVNLGDEADMHALSDYDTDPDGFSAGHELEQAIKHLQPLYKMFPNTNVCTSNHTSRPFRKAYKYGIPRKMIRDYREFLEAPQGWKWSEYFEFDGVLYEHGESFSGKDGALKTALANMQSTVIGHLHAWAGIQYSANPKHLIFGLNSGCLIDKDKYAFAYGKVIKNKPVLGASIVDSAVPMFIPMFLNKRGRWIGKL